MSEPKPEQFGGTFVIRPFYSDVDRQDQINDIARKIAKYLIPRFSTSEDQPDGTTCVNIDMVVMGKKEFDAYVATKCQESVRDSWRI